MSNKGSVGGWCYEVVQVRLRKTSAHGEAYTGIVNATIVNGELHLEGLHCDEFTLDDMRDLRAISKAFGFKDYTFNRYKK